jgi:hypothetical protein
MGTTAAPTNALLTWFAEYGQLYYVGVQVLFWIAIAVAALMIAFQYKRFVSYKVGDVKVAKPAAVDGEKELEAFVE